ncbi:MAG: serpin family protein [Oscillospiraceae bacterium]|nr:serpin family protein [Oscillospiraceae bacterium]
MKKLRIYLSALVLLLTASVILSSCALGISASAECVSDNVKSDRTGQAKQAPEFTGNAAEFSLRFFGKVYSSYEKKNVVVSPVSVYTALAMTRCGANGNTLDEMSSVLCPLSNAENLNESIYAYLDYISSSGKDDKFKFANSIWVRNVFTPEHKFLQTNANFFGADIYKAPFDSGTISDINAWVKLNTSGRIDKMVDQINPNCIMYLINAVSFDAQWKTAYEEKDIKQGLFKTASGEEQNASFMRSDETLYISDENSDGISARGFIRPYRDGFAFVALLPDEGTDIGEYISSLDGKHFISLVKNASSEAVTAYIPKFQNEFGLDMKEALAQLGMKAAFIEGEADFSGISAEAKNDLYIGEATHKTFISVDELGTKAGAASSIGIYNKSMSIDTNTVRLDRPFVYAIVDTENCVPLFIGVVNGI